MKIILLGRYNSNEILSGPEKVAKRLLNHYYDFGENVTFIEYFFKLPDRNSNLFLRLFGKEKVRNNPKVFRLGLFSLFFYLLKKQPDIVHIVTSERFIIPLFVYKFLLKGKILITKHAILKQELANKSKVRIKGKYKDLLLEWFELKFSDGLFFLSNAGIKLAQKYYNIDRAKIRIVANGIDHDFFSANIKPTNARKINFVFYNGTKSFIDRGLKFIIHALNKVKCNCDFEFHIIGEIGSDLLKEAKFSIVVHSIMNKEELIEFLKDKHIVLKSNTFDSFSCFVGECMAMGIVPLISDNVGIERFIESGKNGFVYSKSNPLELSEILKNIIEGKYQLEKISQNAMKVFSELNWQNIASMYINHYKKMFG